MSTQVLEVPALAPPETPRLSALMRVGAQVHPQGRGTLYYNGHTCALGALLVGVLLDLGIAHTDLHRRLSLLSDMRKEIAEHTGVDLDQPVVSPLGGEEMSLVLAIMRLNDGGGWTREAIAEWLESMGL